MRPDWHALVEALDGEANREEAWGEFQREVERLARAVTAGGGGISPSDLAQDVML